MVLFLNLLKLDLLEPIEIHNVPSSFLADIARNWVFILQVSSSVHITQSNKLP